MQVTSFYNNFLGVFMRVMKLLTGYGNKGKPG